MRLSAAIAHVRSHLASWWPNAARARELARQYRVMQEVAPLVVADLLRAGLFFDDTHVQGDPYQGEYNAGRRAMTLHLQAMLNLQPEDLNHLREETEDDGRRE